MKANLVYVTILLACFFLGCSSKIDEAKNLAQQAKYEVAIDKLKEIPQSDTKWSEAKALLNIYEKELGKQQVQKALDLAKQSKIQESLQLIRGIHHPELIDEVRNVRLVIGKIAI